MDLVDRCRACRPGSYAFARVHGGHMSARALVVVARSRICNGRGLRAARFVRKGTPLTTYGGRRTRSMKRVHGLPSRYVYECGPASFIVGNHMPSRDEGIAQLANDAIHTEVTGASNNARFEVWKDGQVYLMADRDIDIGEEILVDYHISYWIALADNDDQAIPESVRDWCRHQAVVERALQGTGEIESTEAYQGVRIVDAEWVADAGGVVMNDDVNWRDATLLGVASYAVRARDTHRKCEVLLAKAAGDGTHLAWRWCSTAAARRPFTYMRTV